jgi:hypothetical protein
MNIIRILGPIALAAGSLAAQSAAADDVVTRYQFAMEMRVGDHVVGQPSLIVEEGKPLRIEIAPGDGSFYNATLIFSRENKNRIGMMSDFEISSPETGAVRALPELELVPGKAGLIEFGQTATGRPGFSARVTVSELKS